MCKILVSFNLKVTHLYDLLDKNYLKLSVSSNIFCHLIVGLLELASSVWIGDYHELSQLIRCDFSPLSLGIIRLFCISHLTMNFIAHKIIEEQESTSILAILIWVNWPFWLALVLQNSLWFCDQYSLESLLGHKFLSIFSTQLLRNRFLLHLGILTMWVYVRSFFIHRHTSI